MNNNQTNAENALPIDPNTEIGVVALNVLVQKQENCWY
jgi:hypothetical protein